MAMAPQNYEAARDAAAAVEGYFRDASPTLRPVLNAAAVHSYR